MENGENDPDYAKQDGKNEGQVGKVLSDGYEPSKDADEDSGGTFSQTCSLSVKFVLLDGLHFWGKNALL